MIDKEEIFAEVKDNMALICGADVMGADLAAVAGLAITNKLHAVSVVPDAVAPLWAWLENTNVKIYSRFYVDKKIDDDFMSDISARIAAVFRDGADGATIFVKLHDLNQFVTELKCVRDDLFFNKTLSIGIDINDVDFSDWAGVFESLGDVRADAITLFLSHDAGDKSDFVGRVYAMLNANMGDWHGALHFVAGKNADRIDQVYRLTTQMRPNMVPRMMFFVEND